MIKIKIEQQDIDAGYAGDCTKCPIAHAIRRQGFDPWVEHEFIALDGVSKKNVYYGVSKKAIDFIDDFDYFGGEEVKPFEFSLTRRNLPIAIDLSEPLIKPRFRRSMLEVSNRLCP